MSKNTKERNELKATVEKLLTPTEKIMYQYFTSCLINNLEYLSTLLPFKIDEKQEHVKKAQTKARHNTRYL